MNTKATDEYNENEVEIYISAVLHLRCPKNRLFQVLPQNNRNCNQVCSTETRIRLCCLQFNSKLIDASVLTKNVFKLEQPQLTATPFGIKLVLSFVKMCISCTESSSLIPILRNLLFSTQQLHDGYTWSLTLSEKNWERVP